MSAALAGAAGALGVLAAWDLIAAVETAAVTRGAAHALAPLRRAAHGREPTPAEAGGWPPWRRWLCSVRAGSWRGRSRASRSPRGGPWGAFAVVRARRRRWREAVHRDAARGPGGGRRAGRRPLAPRSARRRAGRRWRAGPGRPRARGHRPRAGAGSPHRGRARAPGSARGAGRGTRSSPRCCSNATRRRPRRTAPGKRGGAGGGRPSRARRRAVTAQARFTGLLVSVLPLAAAFLAELARPGYLGSLLRSPLTLWLGGCAVAFELAALLLIHRLARVKA